LVVQKPSRERGCRTGSLEYGDRMMYFDARVAASDINMHLHRVPAPPPPKHLKITL